MKIATALTKYWVLSDDLIFNQNENQLFFVYPNNHSKLRSTTVGRLKNWTLNWISNFIDMSSIIGFPTSLIWYQVLTLVVCTLVAKMAESWCVSQSQEVAITTTNKLPLSIFCTRNAKTISNTKGYRAKGGREKVGPRRSPQSNGKRLTHLTSSL